MSRPRIWLRFRHFGALSLLVLSACGSPSASSGPAGSPGPGSGVQPGPPVVDDLPELAPDPREPVLSEIATVLLAEKHLLRRPLDDALSKASFAQYMDQLDGAKLLLLDPHVQQLAKYSDRMDDELREKNLVLARKGAALVAERRRAIAKVVAELLAKPFDFSVAEEHETDPKKLSYCKTEAELRDRWRRALKLQVLERIQEMEEMLEAKAKPKKTDDGEQEPDPVVEKTLAEIPSTLEGREAKARKDLATRYETRFVRLASMDSLEPAGMFLNAVAAAYDPHTQYLAPADKENFDIALTGTLEGIGAVLREQDHYIVVQELVPGGASWQQGKLEAGDLILAVAQHGKPPVDVTDMPIDKVVKMIRGPKGTQVTLTVKKPSGQVETISIVRDVIKVEATYARGAVLDLGAQHDSVGYVYLPGFYGEIGSGPRSPGERNATEDVRALLAEFHKKKLGGVIVDLRGNGGGLLMHARDISGLFIKQGPVVQTRDSDGRVEILADADPSVAYSGQVVVLVDRFSASASEILAAALQDYERAIVIGTGATHGKGTVQAVIELDRLLQSPAPQSLGVFKLTMEQYFRVSGGSVQWKGVTPDIVLPDPAAFMESGERALPHSIPWSSVAGLPYRKQAHSWSTAALAEKSKQRVQGHALFSKVASFGKLVKSKRDQTRETLQRDAWLAKKKQDKAALEAADPKLSEQKPLFDVKVLNGATKTPPRNGNGKVRQKLDSWQDELARDPWVQEALYVLGDMVKAR